MTDAYQAALDAATASHAPLFDALASSGLTGHIWQSGGMTMTIVIPAPTAAHPDAAYLGLREGVTDDGRWIGSVSHFLDGYNTGADDGADVVDSYDTPLAPADWAGLITMRQAQAVSADKDAAALDFLLRRWNARENADGYNGGDAVEDIADALSMSGRLP